MINVFWFRRDLRLEDNHALYHALKADLRVLPVFIFDTEITGELHRGDPRITFIYEALESLNEKLKQHGGSVLTISGEILNVWKILIDSYKISAVYVNRDYEPYALRRDRAVEELLRMNGISFSVFKDHVIFEEKEILSNENKPYTVFTAYKRKWLARFREISPLSQFLFRAGRNSFVSGGKLIPIEKTGFIKSQVRVRNYDLGTITDYDKYRDFPALDKTSYLGPHLRFGTVSIRKIVKYASENNQVFLSELIWREFFMQILFIFPHVVTENFRPVYNNIRWRNDDSEFERWCAGETGYPIVDAGMRQLNETGYMHNRVRMIAAGFLCKHLLTDWRRGEAYFAGRLLDYELSSNNGNWQWAAGTGCDAVPYFRIFNPTVQELKFDKHGEYVNKWVPDRNGTFYPGPVVNHNFARQRALETYKAAFLDKIL